MVGIVWKGGVVHRPTRRTRWVVALLVVYAMLVALVVLTPVSYAAIVHAIGAWLRDSLDLDWFGTGWIEFVANIVMFVPLGLLLTLLTRRHWLGMVLALALSAAAELAQIVVPSRQPSLRDVVANVLGAAVGAAIAWAFVIRREKRQGGGDVTD